MSIKAAFIFIAPDATPQLHQATVVTPEVEVTTLAVRSYAQAQEVAADLRARGINAIELCAGFGTLGVAAVNQAVDDAIPVGVVRFDYHPGLGFKSGDELFTRDLG